MSVVKYNVDDLPANVRSKTAVGEHGCWVWTAAKTKGYGRLGLAHRAVWEILVVDVCMVREAWTEYLTARQIEEALKNG